MLRLSKKIAYHSSQTIFFSGLLIVALYVSIGRVAVNAVAYFEDDLSQLLVSLLKVDVELEQVRGSWSYFDPKILVGRVTIGSADEPAMVFEQLAFKLSSFNSLVELSPVFTEIEVGSAALGVSRQPDGHWRVIGLPVSDKPMDFQLLEDAVPYIERIEIGHLSMQAMGDVANYSITNSPGLPIQLFKEGEVRNVSFPLDVNRTASDGDSRESKISIRGHYRGNPFIGKNLAAQLYIDIPDLELMDFLPAFNIGKHTLTSADLNSSFWIQYENRQLDVTGTIQADKIILADEDSWVTAAKNLTLDFRLLGANSKQDAQLVVPHLGLEVAQQSISLAGANFVMQEKSGKYSVAGAIPMLDLAELYSAATSLNKKLNFIPERALKALTTMRPRGKLEGSLIYADFLADTPDIKITTKVKDVVVDAYLGAPAINALNGFLSLRPDRGYLDINNGTTVMQFASMFSDQWNFDSARGRINYRIANNVLQVDSGLIELIDGDLTAHGKLFVSLPKERDNQTWGLVLSISKADLARIDKYIPFTLAPSLRDWLGKSILYGKGNQAGLIFHGALFRGAPKIRKVYETYFAVEQAGLNYDERWPELSDLAATVYVNNAGVTALGATGTLYNSDITHADVRVPIPVSGKVDTIHVNASLNGPMSDGVKALNETPLAQATNNVAEDWIGSGVMDVTAEIEVPLGPRAEQDPYADVLVTLSENQLVMPGYDLSLADIEGQLAYNSLTGLKAEKFTGELFGEPVAGTINSEVNGKSGEIAISLDGAVDLKDLYRWSDQVLLTRASGLLDYHSVLHVPYGGRKNKIYVEATSQLQGVIIDIPEPIRKSSADSHRDFYYRQTFLDPGYRLNFAMGDDLVGDVQIRNGIVTGGRVDFSPTSQAAVSYDKLRVYGDIDEVNYEGWTEFLDSLDQASDVALDSEMARSVDSINLQVGMLDIYSLQLPNTTLKLTRDGASWLADLENRNLKGTVRLKDVDSEPVNIDLEYFRFFADQREGEEDDDPLADVIPQEIDAIDFSTQELVVEGENYGQWQFEYRPTETGAILQNLTAEVKGMKVISPAQVVWTYNEGVHHSSFMGQVVTDDLAGSLEQWGYAPSIEGKNFSFTSNYGWPGSPPMIDIDNVEGDVAIKGGKGRFVQAEQASGALKILGIFDFNQLARRFKFDFSDVVDQGYEFEKIKGSVAFNQGLLEVIEPIKITASGSNFKVGGKANLNNGELDGDVIVTLPVSKNLPWYAAYSAIFTGPITGAGVFLAQKVFENKIDQMSSAKYEVGGTLDNPDIKFVAIFDDSVRKKKEVEVQAVEPPGTSATGVDTNTDDAVAEMPEHK